MYSSKIIEQLHHVDKTIRHHIFNSFLNQFLACQGFCLLLITIANSLDPDQDWQNVGPDLDPNCLTLWLCSWRNFSRKVNFEKISRWQQKHENYPACKELKIIPDEGVHIFGLTTVIRLSILSVNARPISQIIEPKLAKKWTVSWLLSWFTSKDTRSLSWRQGHYLTIKEHMKSISNLENLCSVEPRFIVFWKPWSAGFFRAFFK